MIPKKRSKDQQNLFANIQTAKQDLLKIPNVLAVGIGLKESNNQFTDEIAYRVFVKEKKDLASLKSDEIIPKTINNIKTDVIVPYHPQNRPYQYPVCGTERLTQTKHRPLKAGILISKSSLPGGTLGWFGTLLSDDSKVILSNEHVLYGTSLPIDTSQRKTAQPVLGEISHCCCCECGSEDVVGTTIIGIQNVNSAPWVDCAITRINPEFVNDIVYQISNDATSEVLSVSGTNQAVVGERVRKIGARSGYTQGIVVHVGDAAVAGTDPAGNTITIISQQVLIIPHTDETYQINYEGTCKFAFSNHGDSGSVILNDSDEIVALLYSGDAEHNTVDVTFANNIQNVLDAFAANGQQITLATTAGGHSLTRSLVMAPVKEKTELNVLEEIRDMNRLSLLNNLFEKHHKEVLNLINNKRPVTIVWQRNQGPAFVAAIVRAAKHKNYQIPELIEGTDKKTLLTSMESILMEHGSAELQNDILKYRDSLIEILLSEKSIEGIAEALKSANFIDNLPNSFSTINI